jgi:hypothetical protein
MKNVRYWLVLLAVSGVWPSEAPAEGYYEWYESYWARPRYQNGYHGYWRDQGYGFSNSSVYGGYQAGRYADFGLGPRQFNSGPIGFRGR